MSSASIANPPLDIAIVGLGFGLHYMSELMKSDRGRSLLRVRAVCDANSERLATGEQAFGCKGYTDLDAMLREIDAPAIGLFSGPVGRAELITKLMRAGRHVMTTKPFEVDPEKVVPVYEEAKRLGKVVFLNSPGPMLSPDLRQIVTWQREHNLGPVLAAQCMTWARYNEKPDGTWYDDPKLCPVAPIFRLGIYALNDMIRLIGPADSVHVMHARLFTGRPTPDHAQLVVRFKNGAMGHVLSSFCIDDGKPYPDRLGVQFERGTLERRSTETPEGRKTRLTLQTRDAKGNPVVHEADVVSRSGDYQWETFCDAVRGKRVEQELTPQQVADAIRIINAMGKSAETGLPQTIA